MRIQKPDLYTGTTPWTHKKFARVQVDTHTDVSFLSHNHVVVLHFGQLADVSYTVSAPVYAQEPQLGLVRVIGAGIRVFKIDSMVALNVEVEILVLEVTVARRPDHVKMYTALVERSIHLHGKRLV